MSLPGKGLEGHICPTIVMPWWLHCDDIQSSHELGGANKIITLWGHELLKCGE